MLLHFVQWSMIVKCYTHLGFINCISSVNYSIIVYNELFSVSVKYLAHCLKSTFNFILLEFFGKFFTNVFESHIARIILLKQLKKESFIMYILIWFVARGKVCIDCNRLNYLTKCEFKMFLTPLKFIIIYCYNFINNLISY